MVMGYYTGQLRAETEEIKSKEEVGAWRYKHEAEEQKGDERIVGGRERKRARGREVLISLDPFVD